MVSVQRKWVGPDGAGELCAVPPDKSNTVLPGARLHAALAAGTAAIAAMVALPPAEDVAAVVRLLA